MAFRLLSVVHISMSAVIRCASSSERGLLGITSVPMSRRRFIRPCGFGFLFLNCNLATDGIGIESFRSVDNISVEIGRYGTYVLFRIRGMNRRKVNLMIGLLL